MTEEELEKIEAELPRKKQAIKSSSIRKVAEASRPWPAREAFENKHNIKNSELEGDYRRIKPAKQKYAGQLPLPQAVHQDTTGSRRDRSR